MKTLLNCRTRCLPTVRYFATPNKETNEKMITNKLLNDN